MSKSDKITSFFEFWPSWVMYAPVALQWVGLALWHRSITLPFLANPELPLSGMVGVPKTDLMNQASGRAAEVILPWVAYEVTSDSAADQANAAISEAASRGITLPFVCKPNIGCRGVGVKLVHSADQLEDIISSYPQGAALLCQKLASNELEAGIFYVKDPDSGEALIESMTIKTLPYVIGDGQRTLGQLIEADPRAGKLRGLYKDRHKSAWDSVPKDGEKIRLVFSASHSKGAIFKDARDNITPELTQAIDSIMQGLPEFYYGRLDVKIKDINSLKRGEHLEVVEINGASSESIHIWDKDTSFMEAMRALLWQYRTLYKLGAYNRKQGYKPPTLREFIKRWQVERRLSQHYPHTD